MKFFVCLSLGLFFLNSIATASTLSGTVVKIDKDERRLHIEVQATDDPDLNVGTVEEFRVGAGDLEIGYANRLIKGSAVNYGGRWNLEQIFPLDGIGAKAVSDINKRLRDATASLNRRKYVKEGDYIPNFGMIDQNGDFFQIRELLGTRFVINFIFTRCTVPAMCPASSSRMSDLQDVARETGLKDLQFVTITFDPEFDSPGILRQYAQGYGIEEDNFHLLTGTKEVVQDLLRQFGILTMEEDGTINHTMATLVIDENGRIAFRKEGSQWEVEEFVEEIRKL